jgi:hypothetical protein
MAFPASPSNNQVHKEGNRAFVYDSTLGTWDQVRETDRTENKILSGNIGGGIIGAGVTFPAGCIVQVLSYTFTGHRSFSSANGVWRDLFGGGNDLTIHLSKPSNKVLINAQINVGGVNDSYLHYKLTRNGTDVVIGDARGSTTRCAFMMNTDPSAGANYMESGGFTYLDDPSETTNQGLQYKMWSHARNGTQYLNRCHSSTDNNRGSPVSGFTLMEIAT